MLRAAVKGSGQAGGDDLGCSSGSPSVGFKERRDSLGGPGRHAAVRRLQEIQDPCRARSVGFHGQARGSDPVREHPVRRRVRSDPDTGKSWIGWEGILEGRLALLPQLGFWVVDVRDLADLHVRAMTSPEAAGQRFIAAGDFMWLSDIANTLRVRLIMPFMPQLRGLAPLIVRLFPLTLEKAQRLLGFAPHPAPTTIVECTEGLLTDVTAKA